MANSIPCSSHCDDKPASGGHILFIESYYGGSHKEFIDILHREFESSLHVLPATKWNWRMRMSALHFSEIVPVEHNFRVLFASSVINLAELVALRPDLAKLHKILFFHENQLVYPVRKHQDRDFQHGYCQILSSLIADKVIFNSEFNKESFLSSIQSFMSIVPDYKPRNLRARIEQKCSVLHVPVLMIAETVTSNSDCNSPAADNSCPTVATVPVQEEATPDADASGTPHPDRPLHLLWPHRWEHDKNPEMFCSLLLKLMDSKLDFNVSIIGSHTSDIPGASANTSRYESMLLHRGHVPRKDYKKVLQSADVVVSTALHEFFGIAMLEAVYCGCYPLCPNKLVYPEIYPRECLYNTEQQLLKKLKNFCIYPKSARSAKIAEKISIERYSWKKLKRQYQILFY